MLELLSPAQYRRMPWKNGSGETCEIKIWPPGSDVHNFDWRISLANVAADGPFSIFPGIGRILSVVEGNGIVLHGDGIGASLDQSTAPFCFPGDLRVTGALIDGAITDFNVMYRRDKVTASSYRLEPGKASEFALGEAVVVVWAANSDVSIRHESGTVLLPKLWTLIGTEMGLVSITSSDANTHVVILSPRPC
ncbi:HutD/Ves family protein [Devosia faecipullorum]|uniref:HutD/Ves family protein n=1 Tax=Devosia faecipullorum TaxID=2755039 RepID=UPI00187BBF29|nr:HutD family protein [Devosia faecipullorum]MBE7732837.1 HutD family protein [Devosia faecipullorum]